MKGIRLHAILVARFQVLELCQEENKEGNAGGVMGKDSLMDLAQGDLEELPIVLPVERLLSDI